MQFTQLQMGKERYKEIPSFGHSSTASKQGRAGIRIQASRGTVSVFSPCSFGVPNKRPQKVLCSPRHLAGLRNQPCVSWRAMEPHARQPPGMWVGQEPAGTGTGPRSAGKPARLVQLFISVMSRIGVARRGTPGPPAPLMEAETQPCPAHKDTDSSHLAKPGRPRHPRPHTHTGKGKGPE